MKQSKVGSQIFSLTVIPSIIINDLIIDLRHKTHVGQQHRLADTEDKSTDDCSRIDRQACIQNMWGTTLLLKLPNSGVTVDQSQNNIPAGYKACQQFYSS